MNSHFRNTCPECGATSQCRCMSPNKTETKDLCDTCKCKTLKVAELDEALDQRKPVRKIIDDHVAPVASKVLGVAGAAGQALANIHEVDKAKPI